MRQHAYALALLLGAYSLSVQAQSADSLSPTNARACAADFARFCLRTEAGQGEEEKGTIYL